MGDLRGRLLALIALLLTAGVALSGVTAYLVLREHLASRVDRTLATTSERLGDLQRTEPVDLTPSRLDTVVPPALAVVLLDEQGEVLLSATPADAASLDAVAELADLPVGEPVTVPAGDGSSYRVVRADVPVDATVPSLDGDERAQVDTVLLGVPLAADEAALRTLLVVELVGGAAVVLVGTLVAAWLLGLGLRPLRSMSRAARRIEAGAAERIPEDRPGSETTDLAVALNAAFDARTSAEARTRTFLADASHELRTPVTAVRAWADLYAAGALPTEADVGEAMASIGVESDRMRALVDQMLVLARLDAGTALRREAVDLRAVAVASVRALGVLGTGRLAGPEEGPPVRVVGDGEALRRVVDNLVTNALRHTPDDSPVSVAVSPCGEVVVTDRGPGLDAEQRELAFDRFWRSDEGRVRPGGSGLGLAIARDLARAHGGDVVLEPAEPGLRAVLRLPVLSESSASPQPTGTPSRTEPSERPGGLRDVTSLPLRRPWLTVLVWLLLVVGLVAADRAFGGAYDNDIDLPGTQAAAGADLLDAHAADESAFSGRVVLHDPDGVPRDETAALADRLGTVPGVAGVGEPVTSGATTYLTVRLDEAPRSLDEETLDGLRAAAEDLPDGLESSWAGPLGDVVEPSGGHRLPELIGLATALLVLLLVFGSVLGALVPLVTAAFAVLGGVALLGLLAATMTFGTTAPTLATMIGLGCGIDYALFLVTRARQHLIDGAEPGEAVRRALRSSGHAVLVAGGTVAVALLGLYASGITFVGQLGLAAVVTLATGAASAVTLVPALLALLGRRIDRWRVRTPVAESEGDRGRWVAYSRWVARHPLPVLVAATALLGLLTVPLLSMQLGHVDEGADPVGSTTRTAYDRLAESFGPGVNGTFTAVLEVDPGTPPDEVRERIAEVDGVASVTPFVPSLDGEIATATVTPTTDPQDDATRALVDQVGAAAPEVLLTGSTVAQIEFGERVVDRLPLIIGIVVAAACVLLTLTFRAPVVALKAALMNLLSIGASYGVLVAIFQWQWGSGLLGVDESVPIEAFVPMMMFAIVFGLSMDYEVFLLSRVRESWLRTGDAVGSVATGLTVTARVISAAALIMISVFLSFALDDDVVIKMMAIGLAVSVLIDATIVRLLLVPATMVLLGRANWWAPRWLQPRDLRARY